MSPLSLYSHSGFEAGEPDRNASLVCLFLSVPWKGVVLGLASLAPLSLSRTEESFVGVNIRFGLLEPLFLDSVD